MSLRRHQDFTTTPPGRGTTLVGVVVVGPVERQGLHPKTLAQDGVGGEVQPWQRPVMPPPPRTHSRQRWRSPRASQRQPRVTRRGHPTSECKATTSRLEKGNPHPRERRSGPGSAGVGAWWSGASGRQWADPPPAGNQHTQDRGISKESADPGPGPGPGPGTVDLKPDGRTPTNGGEPRRPRVGERVEW